MKHLDPEAELIREGRLQIAIAAPTLRILDICPEMILTSTKKRAKETASIMSF